MQRRRESRALGPALTSSAYLSGQIDPNIYELGPDINIIILIIAIMNFAGGKITLGRVGVGGGATEVARRQGAITAPNHQIGLIYDLCRAPSALR